MPLPQRREQYAAFTRRSVLAAGAGLLAGACGSDSTPDHDPRAGPSGPSSSPLSESRSPAATGGATQAELPDLPGGGRAVFPGHRMVGYAGAPRSAALGRLGIGDPDERVRELTHKAESYDTDHPTVPVLELITVVATDVPGPDGLYRRRQPDDVVEDFLKLARRHKALLLLNIQPGRADFIDEVRAFDDWLKEPDVGLALDPEWAVGPGEAPGQVFGHTTGKELDRVAGHVSRLTTQRGLPQKVMVYHQLNRGIVSGSKHLRPHEDVVCVLCVDGIGNRAQKVATWNRVLKEKPEHVRAGFKLFFEEDTEIGDLMSPKQVLKLDPEPDYVLYE